jgi:hypothetical protein
MAIIEARNGPAADRDESGSRQETSITERIRLVWAVFVVSLALLATAAWMILLGSLMYRAVAMLLD